MPGEFPTCDLSGLDFVIENEFNECLGYDFLLELQNDLIDYSEAAAYESKTYQKDDKVVFEGLYYTAINETNNRPTNTDDWVLSKKFYNDCFNDFWCNYLGRFLSLKVYRNSIVPATVRLADKGLTVRGGENFRAANNGEIGSFVNWIDSNIQMIGGNMERHITRIKQNETHCFDNYGVLEELCSCGCGCKENECAGSYAQEYRIG